LTTFEPNAIKPLILYLGGDKDPNYDVTIEVEVTTDSYLSLLTTLGAYVRDVEDWGGSLASNTKAKFWGEGTESEFEGDPRDTRNLLGRRRSKVVVSTISSKNRDVFDSKKRRGQLKQGIPLPEKCDIKGRDRNATKVVFVSIVSEDGLRARVTHKLGVNKTNEEKIRIGISDALLSAKQLLWQPTYPFLIRSTGHIYIEG